ncbi:MAG: hypothetical protein U1E49_09475 [Hyphomicrobiaceae bacterium]
MVQIIGMPKTGAGVAYTLTDGDTFLSFTGDTVFSTTTNALEVTGSDNTLTIGGHAYGSDNGIKIGDSIGTDVNNTVNILAGGVVGTNTDDAIEFRSSNSAINNAGTIAGVYGIYWVSAPAGTLTITNSGLIQADNTAILNGQDDALSLTNTGTIRSLSSRAFDGGTGVDTVVNKGLMVGNVELGGGNDSYDGRLGRVTMSSGIGTVYGEDGDDTLTGGKLADSLDGGANNDTLTGGLGVDLLTGGSGLDKFVFNSVAERGDIISDFSVVDDTIQVKAAAFGGLAKGTLSSAAFFANTTGQAHDASDRFIYETDVDKLWYDSNGNAAGGRVLLADLNDVNFTRFDIQVI